MAQLTGRHSEHRSSRLLAAVLLTSVLATGVVAAGTGVASAVNQPSGNTGNSGNTNTTPNQGAGTNQTGNAGNTNNNTATTNGSTTGSSAPHNNGTAGNGNSGSQAGTSGQTPAPTTTTTSAPPPIVATLTGTGDGVLVHRYNGTTVTGYQGQPLRLHEAVEVIGPPGQPTNANPATIDWLAGGTSDVYDAKPQQFVPGQGFAGSVHTQIEVNSGSGGGAANVLSGFMRFFFPPSDTKRYKFEASTGTVTTSVKGTDFTVGYDPDTKTSAVFVTQDSVDVTPTNTSLKPFTLSAGSQVEVTGAQVGPIAPLGGASAPSPTTTPPKSSSSDNSLGLIVGIVVGVLVLAGLWFLLFVHLPRRRRANREGITALASATTRQVVMTDGVDAASGATQETAPLAGPGGGPEGVDGSSTTTQPLDAAGPWSPTHRAPEGGMGCWATPGLASPVVATLDPGLEVQVIGRDGHWAHIICSNGWSAWVDSRLLLGNGADGPSD